MTLDKLPAAFDVFTILQLSDPHVDINEHFVGALIESIRPLNYDLCVLTGDYCARTFGPFAATLAGLKRIRPHIKKAVYAGEGPTSPACPVFCG